LFSISISLATLRAKLTAQLSLLTPSDRHEVMSDRPLFQSPDVYIFNIQSANQESTLVHSTVLPPFFCHRANMRIFQLHLHYMWHAVLFSSPHIAKSPKRGTEDKLSHNARSIYHSDCGLLGYDTV